MRICYLFFIGFILGSCQSGSEDKRHIVSIPFTILNQLLPAHHQIIALNFRNVEGLAELPHERKAILIYIAKRKVARESL